MIELDINPVGLDSYFSNSEYWQWLPHDFDKNKISGSYKDYVLYHTPERRAFVSGLYLLSAEEIIGRITAFNSIQAEFMKYNLLPFACSMSSEYIYVNYLNSEIFWAKTHPLDLETKTITISDVVLPLNSETLNYCLVCIGVFSESYFEKLLSDKFFMMHVTLDSAVFDKEYVKDFLDSTSP